MIQWLIHKYDSGDTTTGTVVERVEIPYSREQKHVSISDTPMLLIEFCF